MVFSTTTGVTTIDQPPPAVPKATESLSASVYRLAEEYHEDPVLALKIIKCESRMYSGINNQNLDSSGNVWSTDVGPWQINNYYHQGRMAKLGLNIYNTQDNLRYGFMLMNEQGTRPWSASKACWSK